MLWPVSYLHTTKGTLTSKQLEDKHEICINIQATFYVHTKGQTCGQQVTTEKWTENLLRHL